VVLIGYAHAGPEDREGLESQVRALRSAGCERVFADPASWREHPELDRALSELSDGHDWLVVCRLDRLGRSLRDLIATIAELEERGIGFRSLDDGIETGGGGQAQPGVFGALARFDRVLPRERTRAHVTAARERGRRARRSSEMGPLGRMSGLEFAPDLIEPVIGFRQWRLVDAALRSMFSKTAWVGREMAARCPEGDHDPAQTPSPRCTCGIYAYYDPCPRTSTITGDLVSGAVVLWGRIEAHATGVRAEHARIVGLELPMIRGRKWAAVTEAAERLGIPAVPHRELRDLARAHGAPLPSSLRPPWERGRSARGSERPDDDDV
jgi:hypothetical protein